MNGPYTPDLAHPISKLGSTAKQSGWPMDIKVGKLQPFTVVSFSLFEGIRISNLCIGNSLILEK